MSKLKVAWLAPCIGVGGADALMAGLCRYGQTMETVGIILTGNHLSDQHVDWFSKTAGAVAVHCVKRDHRVAGAFYHDDLPAAVRAGAKDADILISWSTPRLNVVRQTLPRLPLVELAQNSDDETCKIVQTNAHVADFYVAVSEAARDLFPQPDQWRVQIIPNGVDAARITPRFGRGATRNRWGVTDAEKVAAYIGRFEKYKRPQVIIQAISQMPGWHAVFVGRGSQRGTLAELAEMLAPGRVHFEDYAQQIGDQLAGADVLALPSDFEGDPLIVHEAHLAGLPVVATQIPPLVEKETKFGKMAELIPVPADHRQLRRALLIAADDTFTPVAAHAHRQTFANFTMSAIAARWEWFLHDCLIEWRRREMLGGVVCEIHAPVPCGGSVS